ncbi:MAG: hypothetical protein A2Y10_11265 [Planctomycetes bacterium GWF2_41_51]|nr:MAG: hypothetical protein A2Y10_11265 [Planctomycetes bacterium GWF2_41_51]HBG28372.1 hypothetical protein [Phycisphaerales bacterium]
MDKRKIYESWKEKDVKISDSFADKVMNKVFEYERRPRFFDVQRIIEIISAHSIIKNSLIVMGAVAGSIRVMYMLLIAFS